MIGAEYLLLRSWFMRGDSFSLRPTGDVPSTQAYAINPMGRAAELASLDLGCCASGADC